MLRTDSQAVSENSGLMLRGPGAEQAAELWLAVRQLAKGKGLGADREGTARKSEGARPWTATERYGGSRERVRSFRDEREAQRVKGFPQATGLLVAEQACGTSRQPQLRARSTNHTPWFTFI